MATVQMVAVLIVRETRPFSTEMTCVGKDVLVSLRHWAGALGNTKGQGKLSLKVGAGTKNYVWDAIKGKTATDAQLKTALEKTLKHHTLRSATHNRIKAEIAHLIS